MKRIFLLVISLAFVSSCRDGQRTQDQEILARIGHKVLTSNMIESIFPDEVSLEDSLNLLTAYVDAWAMEELMYQVAQEELSAVEKDVAQEIESYRRSLLVHKYLNRYVKERLDTLVTQQEIDAYRDEHISYRKVQFYKQDRIKELILRKRRHKLIESLKDVLLENAYNNGSLTINNNVNEEI